MLAGAQPFLDLAAAAHLGVEAGLVAGQLHLAIDIAAELRDQREAKAAQHERRQRAQAADHPGMGDGGGQQGIEVVGDHDIQRIAVQRSDTVQAVSMVEHQSADERPCRHAIVNGDRRVAYALNRR